MNKMPFKKYAKIKSYKSVSKMLPNAPNSISDFKIFGEDILKISTSTAVLALRTPVNTEKIELSASLYSYE